MALKIAYNREVTNFIASSGLLRVLRNAIKFVQRCLVMNQELFILCNRKISTLYHEKIQSFKPDDVINCDETCLFLSVGFREASFILN